jgi:hypothetical protein
VARDVRVWQISTAQTKTSKRPVFIDRLEIWTLGKLVFFVCVPIMHLTQPSCLRRTHLDSQNKHAVHMMTTCFQQRTRTESHIGNVKEFDKWSLMPLIPAWVLVVLDEHYSFCRCSLVLISHPGKQQKNWSDLGIAIYRGPN